MDQKYLLKSITRLALVLMVLCFFSVLADDYAKHLPKIPGQYIDLGSHRLHYRCEGRGSPTIVVDNGIAGSATQWYEVQSQLSKKFRTCVYDRAGYVWSEPGPAPRTTRQIAEELKALLLASDETGPYVIVGHSFGGFTAMRMAEIFASDIAGLVLVDSSTPDVLFDETLQRDHLINPIAEGAATGNDSVPQTSLEMARFLNSRRKALFVQMDEISNFQDSARQVAQTDALRNLPLLILARDPSVDAQNRLREQRWREAQRNLAKLSNISEFHLAKGSDHFIHLRKPFWLANKIAEFATAAIQP